MSEMRTVPCDECGGDGHFEWCNGSAGGEPTYATACCTHCGGDGEEEIELSPIDMADLDDIPQPFCVANADGRK